MLDSVVPFGVFNLYCAKAHGTASYLIFDKSLIVLVNSTRNVTSSQKLLCVNKIYSFKFTFCVFVVC